MHDQLSSEKCTIMFLVNYFKFIIQQYESRPSRKAIKVATMENTDNFDYTCRGSHYVQLPNLHFLLSKDKWII